MMGDEFRLSRRGRRELSAQGIGDLPVQDLPPAPEQGFVGRVLDQRMLEGVARIRRHTGAEQQLRVFDAKTKMGWKETVVNEPANKDDKPVLVDDARQRLIDEVDRIRARKEQKDK